MKQSIQTMRTVQLAGARSGSTSPSSWWTCLNDIINECTSINTGEYDTLIINQGGIQNRISSQAKERFKNEVLPFLMTITCMDTPLTGHIEVKLAEGALRETILHFQCEAGHEITPLF